MALKLKGGRQQKSKTDVSVTLQKGLVTSKNSTLRKLLCYCKAIRYTITLVT